MKFRIKNKLYCLFLIFLFCACKTLYNFKSTKNALPINTNTQSNKEEGQLEQTTSDTANINNQNEFLFSLHSTENFKNYNTLKTIQKLAKSVQSNLQKKPTDISLLLQMAAINLITQNFEQAYTYSQKILKLDLENTEAKKIMAASLLAQGQFELCELIINKILETQKNDSELYNLMGVLNVKQNNFSSAILNFKKAVELNQQNLSANLNLIILYLQNYDFKKITPYIENLKKINADYAEIQSVLAIHHMINNDFANAENIYINLIKNHPKWYWLYYNLALTQYKLDKLNVAFKNIKVFMNAKNVSFEDKVIGQDLLNKIELSLKIQKEKEQQNNKTNQTKENNNLDNDSANKG